MFILSFRFLFLFITSTLFAVGFYFASDEESKGYATAGNITYPIDIEGAVFEVMESFPEAGKHKLHFIYDESVTTSVMQAQPALDFLVKSKQKRSYKVKMRPFITNGSDSLRISELPKEVLAGWLSHELGHIEDYLDRSKTDLLNFAFQYVTDKDFLMKAECRADSFAVLNGRAGDLIQMKRFVQYNDLFDTTYKKKIERLYPDTNMVKKFVHQETASLE